MTKHIQGDAYRLTAFIDPFNKRVRIDDYFGNTDQIIQQTEKQAIAINAEKLIFKVRIENINEFFAQGFNCEAKIDGYFLGADAYFFTKYYQNKRRVSVNWIQDDEMVKKIVSLPKSTVNTSAPEGMVLRKVTIQDIVPLAALYREVFPIYPTPLHDPAYIVKTLEEGTIYYIFEQNTKIISAASAEVNTFYRNAELTDCATLNSHRKHGLMKFLLQKLEEELKESGIYCAYSLARSQSFGMNAAFHQLGFTYRGRMMNNCIIFENLEDMNVWIKDLSR